MRPPRMMTRYWMVVIMTLVTRPGALAHGGDGTQERAVAAIEKLGGTVERDHTPSRHVVSVRLLGDGITDEALEQVKKLADLRELDLAGTRITNDGLAQLKGLRA